jgi:hypothetical protein
MNFKQYITEEYKRKDLFDLPPKFEVGDKVRVISKPETLDSDTVRNNDIRGIIDYVSHNTNYALNYYKLRKDGGIRIDNDNAKFYNVFDLNPNFFPEDWLVADKGIDEEYHDSFKLHGDTIELFKNPSKAEAGFSKQMVRAIIDKNSDLIIWDGRERGLHSDVAKHLKLDLTDINNICLYIRLGTGKEAENEVEISFLNIGRFASNAVVERGIDKVQDNKNLKKYIGGKFYVYREDLGI